MTAQDIGLQYNLSKRWSALHPQAGQQPHPPPDLALFLDMNLSILGAPEEAYRLCVAQVRQE